MVRYDVQIYVLGQRLDLYKDENIKIRSKIQDVKDIKKVFDDFTHTITVPASKNNNEIFKHIFRTDIAGYGNNEAFDTRQLLSASIDLNGSKYRRGYVRFESAEYKSGVAHSYSIRFYGELAVLSSIFQDTKLYELDSWAPYQDWSYASTNDLQQQWRDLLTNGFDDTISDTSIPQIAKDNVRVALASNDDGFYYDSSATNDQDTEERDGYRNIYWTTTSNIQSRTDFGVNLHPDYIPAAIRGEGILDAIESQYSDDVVNNSNRYNGIRFSRGEETVTTNGFEQTFPTSIEANVTDDSKLHFFGTDQFKESMLSLQRKVDDSELESRPWVLAKFEQPWGNISARRSPGSYFDDGSGDNSGFVFVTDPGGKRKNNMRYYVGMTADVVRGSGAYKIQLYDITNGEVMWETAPQTGAYDIATDPDFADTLRTETDWDTGVGRGTVRGVTDVVNGGTRAASAVRIYVKDQGARKPVKEVIGAWRIKASEGLEIRLNPTIISICETYDGGTTLDGARNAAIAYGLSSTGGGLAYGLSLNAIVAGSLAVPVAVVAAAIVGVVYAVTKLINKFARNIKITRNRSVTTSEGSSYWFLDTVPDIKVIDLLAGWWKQWNLTAYADRDRYGNLVIVVKELDQYYEDGDTLDITPYVDSQKYKVMTPQFYNPIIFKHKDSEDITTLNLDRNSTNYNKYGFGAAYYPDSDVKRNELLPYQEYKVETPFNVLQVTNPKNEASATDTGLGISYNWYVNESRSSTTFDAAMHYIDSNAICSDGFMVKVGNTAHQVTTYNAPSFFYRDDNDDIRHSLLFESWRTDPVRYGGSNAQVPNDTSLYAQQYRNYIEEVFNLKARRLIVEARFPAGPLRDLKNSDTIILSNKSYRLNDVEIDLNTGKAKLEIISLNNAEAVLPLRVVRDDQELKLESFTSSIPEGANQINTKIVLFEAVASQGTLDYTYTWRKNNVVISGESGPTLRITDAVEGDRYQVTVYDGAQRVSSHAIIIPEINTGPMISIATPNTTPAAGASVTITATASDAENDSYNIQWFKDGVELAGETGTTYVISSYSTANNGVYTAVATAVSGSLSPVTSNGVTLTQSSDTLTLSSSTLSVTNAAGSSTVTLTQSGSSTTTVSDNATWITTNLSGNTLTITVVANTGVQRSGTVTVTKGSVSKTVTVTQAAASDSISFDSSSASLTNASGNSTTVNVTQSGPSTATVSDNATWLTSSISGNVVTLTTSSANTGLDRTATVTVTKGSATDTLTVTQAHGTNTLSLASSTASLTNANNNSTTVTITQSGPSTTSCSESAAWMSCSVSGNTLTITSTQANTGNSRSATVTVTKGNQTATVTVTQAAGASSISFDDDTVSLANTNGATASGGYTTSGTGTISVSESASWLTATVDTTNNEVDYTTSSANTGAARSATVTITRGTATDTQTVTQAAGADSLSLSASSASLTNANSNSTTVTITQSGPSTTSCSESVAWMSCSISGNTLTITSTQANTGSSRSANVTVTKGTQTATVSVTQAAGADSISFDDDTISLANSNGATASGGYTASGPSTVSVSESATWLTATVDTTNNEIDYTTSSANTGAARSATVTITKGSSTDTQTVTQAAAASNPLSVSISRSPKGNIPSGDTVTFTATPTGGNGNTISYAWTVTAGSSVTNVTSGSGTTFAVQNDNNSGSTVNVTVQVSATQSGSTTATATSNAVPFVGTI